MAKSVRNKLSQIVSRGALGLMICSFIIGSISLLYINATLPDVSVLKDMHMQVPLRVITSDGKLMAQYGTKRRIPVELSQMPPLLINAVLAVEDARYYDHPGVDFIGILRAAKAVILSGHKVQGASTITMQVARNFFLTRKKSYYRKIREILLALKIDKELSKGKVLELYLNKVYFGNRAYGVAAAAAVYYGKPLDQLSLAQMAMIAGLPQAPSKNNPIASPTHALERRNHVLERMLEVGFISKKQYNQAIAEPVTAKYHGQTIQFHAPYIAELVRRTMVAEFGASAYDAGYTVTTTINSRLQKAAQQSLEQGLIDYAKRHGFTGAIKNLGVYQDSELADWRTALGQIPRHNLLTAAAVTQVNARSIKVLLANGQQVVIGWPGLQWARPALKNGYVGARPKQANAIVKPGDVIWVQQHGLSWALSQAPVVQGALVSLNPVTGGILALTGGYDYSLSKFNRVTQALRQPGSSFKPFIYSAALSKGFTLASIINDAPVVMADSGENQLWRPRNDTLKFYGPTRLRIGLAKSRNLVSIRLLQDISIPYALNYATRFGFQRNQLPNSLSLALGSASVKPAQLANGYAVFANGGYRVSPYFIETIKDQNNKVLYQANYPKACESCLVAPAPDAQSSAVLNQETVGNVEHETASQPASTQWAPKVISPQNAYIMTQAMQDVIQHGTARAAKVLRRDDLAGKTGTTNKQVDAWFAGFNNKVLAVVWVGFDNLHSLHEYGSKAALPIWINYMRQALAGVPESSMPTPEGIVSARIDPRNGLLAREGQTNSIFEVFRKQYEPTQFSQARAPSQQPSPDIDPNAGSHVTRGSGASGDEPLF